MASKSKHRPITALLLTIAVNGLLQTIQAQPTLAPAPGSSILRSEVFYTQYRSVFDMDGELRPVQQTSHSGINLQSETGLHRRWTLLIQAPVLIVNGVKGEPDYVGGWVEQQIGVRDMIRVRKPGDIECGIRYGFLESKNTSAGFSLMQSLGTAYRAPSPFLNTGFADFNTRIRFDVQHHRMHWFGRTYMAFNNRNNGNGDEFHAGLNLNMVLVPSIRIDWNLRGYYNFENGDSPQKLYQSGLFHQYAALISTGAELQYQPMRDIQFFTGIDFPIRGQYIHAGTVCRAGVTVRLGKDRFPVSPDHFSSKSFQRKDKGKALLKDDPQASRTDK